MTDILLSNRIALESNNKIYAEHILLANENDTKFFLKPGFNAESWSILEGEVAYLTLELRKTLYADVNAFNLTAKSDRYWDIIALHWINRMVRIVYYKHSLLC